MSGRWRCPFAFVPSESYGCFSSFCTQIKRKLDAGLNGMNDLKDFYRIAEEIGKLDKGEHTDLTWCRVGNQSKQSQVHGAAPWARMLDFTNRTTGAANPLVTHGFKNAALAPDPEHCLMAIIKNVFYGKPYTQSHVHTHASVRADTYHRGDLYYVNRIRAENAKRRRGAEDSES